MTAPTTSKPTLRAPGLKWRAHNGRWLAYWYCPDAIKKQGYFPTSQRLWAGLEMSSAEAMEVGKNCVRLQAEARAWMRSQLSGGALARRPKVGTIYFVLCGGLVKIGFTATSVQERIRHYRVGSQAVHLIGCIPGSKQIEQFLHWQFRKLRRHGEWFLPEEPLRRFLDENVPGGNLDWAGPLAKVIKENQLVN